jgi:hypothetical protein
MNNDCPICGVVHTPCIICCGVTRCSPDAVGEAFTICDDCDEVEKREMMGHIPRDDWPDEDVMPSYAWWRLLPDGRDGPPRSREAE